MFTESQRVNRRTTKKAIKMRTSYGFNLVELMVAVAVIGILAGIAVPGYQQYVARAAIDSCYKFITPARMTADYSIQNNNGLATGAFSASPRDDLGLSGGNTCTNVVVGNLDGVNNGDIDISGVIRGNTMRWRRDGANGIWACTTTVGDSSLSPQVCP